MIIYNFELIEENKFPFSLHNRAFLYGDALFETLMAKQKSIRFFEDHLARLSGGLTTLGIEYPNELNPQHLEPIITKLMEAKNLEDARLKILAWRTHGGLFTPENNALEFIITAAPAKPFENHVKENVGFFEDFRLYHSPLSAYKTTNAQPYVMAGIEMKKKGWDDIILLDTDDHVAECLSTNLYWVKDNTIFSPSKSTGCICGVMQQQIIKLLEEKGNPLQFVKAQPEELSKAEAIFTSNVTGISYIKTIDSKSFSEKHPMVDELKSKLDFK